MSPCRMACGRLQQDHMLVCGDCWSLVPKTVRQSVMGGNAAAKTEALWHIAASLKRGVTTQKKRSLAWELRSSCGRYTMRTKERADGSWEWIVIDEKGDQVGQNVCRKSEGRKAEQNALSGAKRRVRALQRASMQYSPPTVDQVAGVLAQRDGAPLAAIDVYRADAEMVIERWPPPAEETDEALAKRINVWTITRTATPADLMRLARTLRKLPREPLPSPTPAGDVPDFVAAAAERHGFGVSA
jgi:hypothetical protein